MPRKVKPSALPPILRIHISPQTFTRLKEFDLHQSLHSRPLIHSSLHFYLSLSVIVSTRKHIRRDVGEEGTGLLSRRDDVRIYAYMDFFKYTFQIRFSHPPSLRAPRREEK